MSAPWFGCIADDYTGGTDVAAALRRHGVSTTLVFGPPDPGSPLPGTDAVVVALKTRTAPVSEAVETSGAAARWLLNGGADQLYVKYCSTFDSTSDGNIGPVLDRVLDEAGEDLTVLCPASPEHGRTVFHGHLFVGDRLLSESSMATHPLTPMTDPDLQRVLAPQTAHPVAMLPHSTLIHGDEEAAKALVRLRAEGVRHVISDAVDDTDLDVLAAATSDLRVVSGGAGLARAMAARHPAHTVAARELPAGPSVVVAGSCSQATLGQVEHARATMPSFHLSPALGPDMEEIWDQVHDWLLEHQGDPAILVYSSASADERSRTQHVFGDRTADVLEHLLARVAAHAVAAGARRVVVAGGETSGAVVQALGVDRVDVAQEADTGIPWCLTPGERPVALLLKSGNFGSDDLLTRAVTA